LSPDILGVLTEWTVGLHVCAISLLILYFLSSSQITVFQHLAFPGIFSSLHSCSVLVDGLKNDTYYAKGLAEYMWCAYVSVKKWFFIVTHTKQWQCFMQLRMVVTCTKTCVLLKQAMCLRSHAFFDSWKNFRGAQGSTQIFFCEISGSYLKIILNNSDFRPLRAGMQL
jgi:hypothetical protein